MLTALVVEDSLTDIQLISSYLTQAGFKVVPVASGEEAQQQIQLTRTPVDLIVIDVILPGQSGFELCRALKSDSSTRPIPIVIYSSKNSDADKMWGQFLGADAYLAKPINQHELIQTVNRLCTNLLQQS
jgi:two-component system, chemotaxis family, response regulator PixH